MKVFYVCDLCGFKSEDRVAVKACEALGACTDLPPVGLIVEVDKGPALRCAKGDPGHPFIAVVSRVLTGRTDIGIAGLPHFVNAWPHGFDVLAWWFRGNGDDIHPLGDGRADSLAGLSQWTNEPTSWRDRWAEAGDSPTFRRAVARCVEFGITPTVLRGCQVVPALDADGKVPPVTVAP